MAVDHDHGHGIWTHDHVFLGAGHARAENRARLAALITAVFMVVEIAAGLLFGSMALLADGFHMATHVGALGLAAGAYWLARRYARDTRFTFGSGKFGDLAAFASAVVLGLIALGIAIESIERLLTPVPVHYANALGIAALGLVVNLVSALVLRDAHDHEHGHHHTHDSHHMHDHADHNMRAAYVHVLADAATSLLAIGALAAGLFFGVRFLDPLVGVIGAFVIASWAYGLIRDSALVLLDAEDNAHLAGKIRGHLEDSAGTRVSDLHLWRLGPGHRGLIVSLISPLDTDAQAVKEGLRRHFPDLSHVTVEVVVCADCGAP
ncbi:MAG TPA: CDF family Co(II)/Ni(II) efflux transporter DmeF [Rhizomicrobium sp.]|nr:CDF family Co(II)/Ni(II) efflux transporter DmeF [Rhizomicrobium sp.]